MNDLFALGHKQVAQQLQDAPFVEQSRLTKFLAGVALAGVLTLGAAPTAKAQDVAPVAAGASQVLSMLTSKTGAGLSTASAIGKATGQHLDADGDRLSPLLKQIAAQLDPTREAPMSVSPTGDAAYDAQWNMDALNAAVRRVKRDAELYRVHAAGYEAAQGKLFAGGEKAGAAERLARAQLDIEEHAEQFLRQANASKAQGYDSATRQAITEVNQVMDGLGKVETWEFAQKQAAVLKLRRP